MDLDKARWYAQKAHEVSQEVIKELDDDNQGCSATTILPCG
jgi:hypothetical protein